MENRGFLGGLFNNDELLWFIILFLLLFYNNGYGYGYGGCCNGAGCKE